MATSGMLKAIVGGLNSPPFFMNLSLVIFDDKLPAELIEVLDAVLVYVDKNQEMQSEEAAEDAAARIARFLFVLGYPMQYDIALNEGLMKGDKKIIYPILSWLLADLAHHKKRAYLSNYLVDAEIPAELLADEGAEAAYQQYRQLQDQFKVLHATLEKERESSVSPVRLQREIAQLESEKDQLMHKISNLKEKTSRESGFQQLFDATSSLRQQQEEEVRLTQRLEEQKTMVEKMEQQHQFAADKLQQLQSTAEDNEEGAIRLLEILTSDVLRNREKVDEQANEIQEKAQQVEQVDLSLGEVDISEESLAEIESQVDSIRDVAMRLEKTSHDENEEVASSLSIYKQQANLVATKKQALTDELNQLKSQHQRLLATTGEKEKHYEKLNGYRFLTRDQFKEYAINLKGKTIEFKQLKAQLAEIRGDVAILGRTEQVLRLRIAEREEQMKSDEAERGVAGHQDTAAGLEEVSIQKAQTDQAKGDTLVEITNVVKQIAEQLKHCKIAFAPHVKNLRAAREAFQEMEVQHIAKKNVYDSVFFGVEDLLHQSRTECSSLQTEYDRLQQSFFETNIQLKSTDRLIQRAASEETCLRVQSKHSKDQASLTAELTAKSNRADQMIRELRKEQKETADAHETQIRKKQLYQCLTSLLSTKITSLQEPIDMQLTSDKNIKMEVAEASQRLVVD
eukprot:GHVS01105417.1.p1 GENE.GHVS01105417.1~~GHVS01105417.1.p1  ORF type:complete len:681 (-),score=121.12 GHVS01105417.1:252-2294(-)